MLLTEQEIVAVVGTDLVMEVSMMKFRHYGNAMGTLRFYQDHFEWCTPEDSASQLHVPYESVEMLRVSSLDKPKVQLQACLYSSEHLTFTFGDSSKSKEHLLADQKRVRDKLQSLLVRHRKILNQYEKGITDSATNEDDTKKQLLKKSWLLKVMYSNLVITGILKPDVFWKMYYKPHEAFLEHPGVSNGFMFDVTGDIGPSGIKMNLTPEIIRQIYRTYPAIERKYIEYVPNLMNEETFWGKFFESHYFNRERIPENKKNDPFAECIEEDEAHMEESSKRPITTRRDKNLLEIKDDDGLYADQPELFLPALSDKKKIIRRLNDFSDRVLETVLDQERNGPPKVASVVEAPKDSNDMEVDNSDPPNGEGENDEDGIVDPNARAYECYVKMVSVPETSTTSNNLQEIPIPEDFEFADQELALVDQQGVPSDDEMPYEVIRSGRNVNSRFHQLELPLDFFEDACDELINEIQEADEGEDNMEIAMSDIELGRKMELPYQAPQKPTATPPMPSTLLRKVFAAHVIVFELSRQARNLIAVKTPAAAKNVVLICSALKTIRAEKLSELKTDCLRQIGPGTDHLIDYLYDAVKTVFDKCSELKDMA